MPPPLFHSIPLLPWLFGRCARQRAKPASTRHELPVRKVISFASATPQRVTCLRGSLWITGGRETVDYVLAAGKSKDFPENSRIVVEGLDDSLLEKIENPPPLPLKTRTTKLKETFAGAGCRI